MPRALGDTTRLLVVGVLCGLVASLAAPGLAAAQTDAPPGAPPDEPYSELLVSTAANDLRLPWQSVPAVLSVLATLAANRQAVLDFLKAQEEAVRAAYEAAVEAAARQGPAASAVVQRARSRCGDDFACFKECTLDIESDGNYGAVSPGGTYRGAWQFDQSTWDGAVARAGYPEWSGRDPAQAPPGVQDAAARQLYQERGNQPWGGRC